MEEIFKEVSGYGKKYFISNFGVLKNEDGEIYAPFMQKQTRGYAGKLSYKLTTTDGKRTSRYAHSLVADMFLDKYEVYNVNEGFFGKKYSKKVIFIDGDCKNICSSNLEFYARKPIIRRAYSKPAKDKGECIKNIIARVNLDNVEYVKKPNQAVIAFLNGDENALSVIFSRYYKSYLWRTKYTIKCFKVIRGKKRDMEVNVEDLVQMGYIEVINSLKRFMYNGGSFYKWSQAIIVNTAKKYMKKQREDMSCNRVENFNYEDAWQSL